MNVLKSIVMISSVTFFSRVLGFIRDTIVARVFGAGMVSDAFFVAFKIPNMLRRIFAEGAFSQVFIPILTEYKNQHNDKETCLFIAYIAGYLILILLLITIFGILIAPWIIMIVAPGFIATSEKFILTTNLLRITFPYILLISLSSLIGAIMNTWNYFLVPAFAPALLNISMIVFILLTSPMFNPPIVSLAWSTLIGGILQISYQLFFLKKIDMLILPRIQLHNIHIQQILKRIGNSIFSISVSQISLIINTVFSSFLISGSVSWIYYADRIIEFPSGVLGVTLSTILLPLLSHSCVKNNYEEYSRLLDYGLRLCLILTIPSSVALIVLAHPLVVTLFQYGKFSAFDTIMTQQTLIAYAIGLVGLMIVKILSPSFYSRCDIKTPIRIAIITLIITQIINFAFIGLLKHISLSLSISLAAYLNAALLYWYLHKQKIFQFQPGWLIFFIRVLFATTIMALILIKVLSIMPDWVQGNMYDRILRLTSLVIIGITSYFITLRLSGLHLNNIFKYKTNI